MAVITDVKDELCQRKAIGKSTYSKGLLVVGQGEDRGSISNRRANEPHSALSYAPASPLTSVQ